MFRLYSVRHIRFMALVVLALTIRGSSVATADRIYWSAGFFFANEIQSADPDGSNIETVITGLLNVEGMALDVANGKMYWTDLSGQKIQRANLDGSNVEDLIGAIEPFGIALDLKHDKMYWTDNNHKLHRANLDGSDGEELIGPIGLSFGSPRGIALDVAGGKMYWCIRVNGTGKIQRANLDGSNVEDLVTGLTGPLGIALDPGRGQMYWIDGGFLGSGKVQRATLDGSNVEDLIESLFQPRGIALDLRNSKMYWTDLSLSRIQRANLDGSSVEDVLSALAPDALALDVPEPTIAIEIDIKPRSFPNSINPRSKGVIPVAILTTPTFDATTVDPLSVLFGPDGAMEAHGRGHIEDADGDGDDDLVLHFRTQATGIQCGDTSASLAAQTGGGQAIQGSDSIVTVGCR